MTDFLFSLIILALYFRETQTSHIRNLRIFWLQSEHFLHPEAGGEKLVYVKEQIHRKPYRN